VFAKSCDGQFGNFQFPRDFDIAVPASNRDFLTFQGGQDLPMVASTVLGIISAPHAPTMARRSRS
jgi:hypothetical protein